MCGRAGRSGDPLFLSSPKILEAMQAFLRGGKIPVTRISLPPVEFTAPRRVAAVSDEVLSSYVGSYRIDGSDVRRVMKAGKLLYTQRGRGPTLPIRPTSKTEFFYEGSATHLRFDVDDNGKVRGMLMYHDGASEAEPARKID